MTTLTEKQQDILAVIRQQIEIRGHAPTVREIGALVNLSSSCTVKKHLDNLELKGYIRRDRYKRGIELMDEGAPMQLGRAICVPLLGKVAGGVPMLAEQADSPEMLPLPLSLLPRGSENGRDLFALEVSGRSMVGAGIDNGDIVIARKQTTARDGEIVVALIGDDATVKTFFAEKDGVRLQPQNPDFEPIFSQDVAILGRVLLAIKKF